MFKAMLLICSLVHGSGDERSCFEIHDTVAPHGYTTEKKCRVRVKEMAVIKVSKVIEDTCKEYDDKGHPYYSEFLRQAFQRIVKG